MENTTATKDSLPKSLRILCLGDSLTAGWSEFDPRPHPYGDTMQNELAHMLSTTPSQIHTKIDGFSGDQVRGAYMRRMKYDCAEAAKQPYDWIIVMGGTNDLAWGQPPEVIYENLSKSSRTHFHEEMHLKLLLPSFKAVIADYLLTAKVWRVALDSGAKVLALNVIEAASTLGTLVGRRNDLNAMIAKHEEDRFYTFDLWSVIRYTGIDEETRKRIWDDGLHLTAEGYRVMGKAVAARIFELLQSSSE
ncbi:MAG: hypothetical protein Q9217_001554 [Psora testacea]